MSAGVDWPRVALPGIDLQDLGVCPVTLPFQLAPGAHSPGDGRR